MFTSKFKNKVLQILPTIFLHFLNRIKSPLIPVALDSICVSDLFIIPNTKQYSTYFELLNLTTVLNPAKKPKPYKVLFKAFDQNGILKYQKKLINNANPRTSISVNKLLKNIDIETGTFACFHLLPKSADNDFEGVLCERGYVGISKRNSNTKSYVHGNYDCISLDANYHTKCLMQNSYYKKYYYNIQFAFSADNVNILLIVNPTNSRVKLTLYSSSHLGYNEDFEITTLGLLEVKLNTNRYKKYVIKSNCKMLRPILLLDNGQMIDILHS